MSDYYFAREIIDTPFYDFLDELSDAVPANIFSYPNKPVPLIKKLGPLEDFNLVDMFLIPSLSIHFDLFENMSLGDIFGVNWVDVTLFDKGDNYYKMLQLCNEVQAIDRNNSDFEIYDEFDGGEFISGMHKLVVNETLIDSLEVGKRLIFRDPGWRDKIFYHESIVKKIMASNVKGIEFFSVDGYSEFLNV